MQKIAIASSKQANAFAAAKGWEKTVVVPQLSRCDDSNAPCEGAVAP